MSSPTPKREFEPDGEPRRELDLEPEAKGPSLILLYGLLILGLLTAMGFGAMIVWPFYLRR